MSRGPPSSTLFPTRRSSDLLGERRGPRPAVPAGRLGPPVGVQPRGGVRQKVAAPLVAQRLALPGHVCLGYRDLTLDRKSTRLNSSHGYISYAVFCLKKKKNI